MPAPPIAARAASCRGSGASAGTASLVSCSTTPVVARAPRTLIPIDIPASREVRGISDGPRASSAATDSSGAAGDDITGFSHLASRPACSDQSTSRTRMATRRIAHPPEPTPTQAAWPTGG